MSEREAFEAWARSIGKTDRDLQKSGYHGDGQYIWRTEQQMFEAWNARAAIEAQRVPDDGFAVNFVVHAGLDKQTARKCESIVREMLSSAPPMQHQEMQAQPAERKQCPNKRGGVCGKAGPCFSPACGG